MLLNPTSGSNQWIEKHFFPVWLLAKFNVSLDISDNIAHITLNFTTHSLCYLIKFKIFKFKILFDFIAPNHNIQLPQDTFVRSTTTVRVYFSLLQRHTSDSFFFVFGSAPMRAAFQLHSDTHSPLLAPASLNHKGRERELNNKTAHTCPTNLPGTAP